MKMTKEESKNFKTGIVTREMLKKALFSLDKRIQNHLDTMKIYGIESPYYQRYNDRVVSLQGLKKSLLNFVKPEEIHRLVIISKRVTPTTKVQILNFIKELDNKKIPIGDIDKKYTIVDNLIRDKLCTAYTIDGYTVYLPYVIDDSLPIKVRIDYENLCEDISNLVSINYVKKVLSICKNNNLMFNSDITELTCEIFHKCNFEDIFFKSFQLIKEHRINKKEM